MKNNLKKGFTLVELVIVIAVIAILSAVLIPTFSNLVQKANVSADTQLVKNLNTALSLGNRKHATMYEALQDAKEEGGMDVAKINASATHNEILWDSVNDVFCYLNDGDIEYTPKTVADNDELPANDYRLWRIASSVDSSSPYSTYLYEYDGNGTITTTKGIDCGDCTNIISITYENTSSAQDVIIRTNGGTLEIKDTNASSHQSHYGTLDKAEVSTGTACYVEHGVVDYMKLDNGKAVAGEGGIIYLMKAESETAAAEEDGGVIIIPTTQKSTDIKTSNLPTGYTVSEDGTTQPADIATKIAANQGLLGSGTEADPYQVYDKESMQAMTYMYDSYNYFKVNIERTNNGVIDCKGWNPVKLHGSFDGNGVKFVNVDATLFQSVGYQKQNETINLKNYDVTFDHGKAHIHEVLNGGTTVFNDVDIHGTIENTSAYHLGAYYNYGPVNYDDVSTDGRDYTVEFIDCQSDATIICGNSAPSCFIGHTYEGNGKVVTIKMDSKTEFTGTLASTAGTGKAIYVQGSNESSIKYYVDGTLTTLNNTFNGNCVKLATTEPTKGADGYYVTKANNATKIVAVIAPQLTAFDSNNSKIQNLSGITMSLSSTEFEELSENVKVCDLFNSIVINSNAEAYSSSISANTLTCNIASKYNFQTGWIRLNVYQYNGDQLIACGTLQLAIRDTAQSGKLSDCPATWTIN